jgi:hypothetical protein
MVSGSWKAPPQCGQGQCRRDMSRAARPSGYLRSSSTIVVEPRIGDSTAPGYQCGFIVDRA